MHKNVTIIVLPLLKRPAISNLREACYCHGPVLTARNQALSAFANEYFTNWQLINWLHQTKSRCWFQDSYPFDLLLQCQIPNHYAKEIENVHMLRTNVSNTLFFQKTTCFLLHLFKIPKLLWNSLNDPN